VTISNSSNFEHLLAEAIENVWPIERHFVSSKYRQFYYRRNEYWTSKIVNQGNVSAAGYCAVLFWVKISQWCIVGGLIFFGLEKILKSERNVWEIASILLFVVAVGTYSISIFRRSQFRARTKGLHR
jgi:hypothetical protein